MLFRQKKNVFIRCYGEIGYIIDNTSYADRIFDKSGAVFLKAISRKPKTLESIASEIARQFNNADPETLKNDALEFISYLEQDGFVVSGINEQELSAKDTGFSYKTSNEKKHTGQADFYRPGNVVNSESFLNGYFREVPTLFFLQIEILNKCNERCIHCYIPHKDKIKSLDRDVLFSILEQYQGMGGLFLSISGGECMLHRNFMELLRQAKKMDFAVTVLSNLTLLTDEIIEGLKDISLSKVQVSLYSMIPEVHDSITKVPGSFKKTYNAILRLIDNNVPVEVSCPIMKQNKDTYQDVYKFADSNNLVMGVDYIMAGCGDHTTVNLENRISTDEMREVIRYIVETDDYYQKRLNSYDFDTIDRNLFVNDIVCNACINSIAISAAGDVVPCAMWYGNILGNIRNDLLSTIWTDSAKIKSVRKIRKTDFPQCMRCENIYYCGLCMARNANENPHGDFLSISEPTCKAASFIRETAFRLKEKQQTTGVNSKSV
jgi:radical SAM protein with 4Fe4S-binding SPASM domain